MVVTVNKPATPVAVTVTCLVTVIRDKSAIIVAKLAIFPVIAPASKTVSVISVNNRVMSWPRALTTVELPSKYDDDYEWIPYVRGYIHGCCSVFGLFVMARFFFFLKYSLTTVLSNGGRDGYGEEGGEGVMKKKLLRTLPFE